MIARTAMPVQIIRVYALLGEGRMRKKLRYLINRYKFIFLGLFIADYLINILTGSGLGIFFDFWFFVSSLIGTAILYLLIVLVVLAFRWKKLPVEQRD